MSVILSAFASGLIFGLSLLISQMVNPAKVLAFLDIFGDWDPTLAVVMGAAVAASALGHYVAKRRGVPLFGRGLDVPTRSDLEPRLLAGAALFGVGWGLVGLCPGPAITALSLGLWQVIIFVAAMFVGMALFIWFRRTGYSRPSGVKRRRGKSDTGPSNKPSHRRLRRDRRARAWARRRWRLDPHRSSTGLSGGGKSAARRHRDKRSCGVGERVRKLTAARPRRERKMAVRSRVCGCRCGGGLYWAQSSPRLSTATSS